MRGMCLLGLILLAGCATKEHTEDLPATSYWAGDSYDFDTPQPATASANGSVTAEMFLVDLDEAVAHKLLGITGPNDIAPKSFREPMGEIAGVNACYGHGQVLTRPSIELNAGTPTVWSWKAERIYLQDWEQDLTTPRFGIIEDGVTGTIAIKPVEGGHSLTLEMTSAQLATPVQEFTTGSSGRTVKIQTPNLTINQRVATETIRPGETAMFQLSRAAHEDSTRIRLLFVRLVAAE